MNFREILGKYLNSNEEILYSDNVIHEMNGVVLTKTSQAIFDFYGLMIDEVTGYCIGQGIVPDKILFLSSYDIEAENAPLLKMHLTGDARISVVEEDGLKIARVCVCEKVSIKEDTGDG